MLPQEIFKNLDMLRLNLMHFEVQKLSIININYVLSAYACSYMFKIPLTVSNTNNKLTERVCVPSAHAPNMGRYIKVAEQSCHALQCSLAFSPKSGPAKAGPAVPVLAPPKHYLRLKQLVYINVHNHVYCWPSPYQSF